MLLRTRLTLLFALSALGLIGAAGLVLWGWQSAQDARFNQVILDAQRVGWRKIEAGVLEHGRRQAQSLAADAGLLQALRMAAPERLPPLPEGVSLDVFDQEGHLFYTSSTALAQETLLDAGALRHLLAHGEAGAGLAPTSAGGFIFVIAEPVWQGNERLGGLALGIPVDAALDDLASSLGVEVALFNLRGHAEKGNGRERFKAVESALALRRDSVADVQVEGRDYLVAGTPVVGYDGRPAGGVATLRDVTDERDRARLLIVGMLGGALLLGGVSLIGLFFHLRQAFAPLGTALEVLTALSRGDTSARLDAERLDEAGQIAAGVARLRGELINLEILREERQREARRQAGIIRDELRALAGTLEPEARQEILADMEHALATHGDVPASGEDGENNQLATLAFVLARLSARIRDQQGRLLKLVADLNEALKTNEAFALLRQELEIARRMQQSVLPRLFPPRPEVALASFMLPAKEVGGDFYDYFLLDERRLGIVIADVSGKGVPAAFFMAISRTLLKASARFVASPAECLARVNTLLAAENEEMMFVTAFYGVLDLPSGHLSYASGGHNPPVLLGADGVARFLPRPAGMALAVMEDMPFVEAAVDLEPGDVLFLYTDGITEAVDPDDALFGDQALLRTLSALAGEQDPARYAEAVVAAVASFARGAPQADDITCVSLRYAG